MGYGRGWEGLCSVYGAVGRDAGESGAVESGDWERVREPMGWVCCLCWCLGRGGGGFSPARCSGLILLLGDWLVGRGVRDAVVGGMTQDVQDRKNTLLRSVLSVGPLVAAEILCIYVTSIDGRYCY